MAEDSDIPPLEDMTEVLKQASAVRAGMLDMATDDKPQVTAGNAKSRAKVKKNIHAKVVNLESVTSDNSAGDCKIRSTPAPPAPSSEKASSQSSAKVVNTSSGESFGGLKKGFLFGGTPKSSHSNENKGMAKSIIPVDSKEEKPGGKVEKDDMVFIVPEKGKKKPGLTIDEVQQAMTEAKGLLENQDWITDDLLNKVEKNALLLKRFGDPNFMKALQEFQNSPTAAMEKYKGNKEMEKFLVEFCGLLGDHFTKLDNSSDNVTKSKTSSSTQSKTLELSEKKTQPRIVEIVDKKPEPAELNHEQKQNLESNTKKCQKITEVSDIDKNLGSPLELQQKLKIKMPKKDIKVHSSSEKADIKELPASDDDKVKEMLKNPQVMEVLLDPKIMNLIQQLKTDPKMAQRIVDTADMNFKDKIKFLVSRGLLQFQ